MSETELDDRSLGERIRPRIEFEERSAPRLEPAPLPLAVLQTSPPGRVGTAGLAAGGAATLAVGLAAMQTGNFVYSQFEHGVALGTVTLLIAVAGFGLIGAAIWREIRGLFALAAVDRLSRELADPARARAAALRWVDSLPDGTALKPALQATSDPAAIAALLRAGPAANLRAQAETLGRTAALQVFAAAAAVPSPALDGLLVAWRGARLVREVAELHGFRPGLLATFALLRRTAFAAASVMATDMALDAATRALLTNPLLQHVIGDMAGAGVAARRMVVLARAAAAACEPLPPA